MLTTTENSHDNPHGSADTSLGRAIESYAILAAARETAPQIGSRYAGVVTPQEAWQLFSRKIALLVDVRTAEERKFVGYVPDTLHIAWMTGAAMLKNPSFLQELNAKANKSDVILFLCRSGKRSDAAAEAASKAGFHNAFNISEGFEGDLINGQRGIYNGWRSHDLPWEQD